MPSTSTSPSRFAATRWSVVVAARHWREDSTAKQAMGDLAKQYWFPLYAYLRRKGCSAAEAEDVVQGFFGRLLEKDSLLSVDQGKGKFRSFLLASLKNYLANERDREKAKKRGGGKVISLDGMEAEARYGSEPEDARTPERVFERRWALEVLQEVMRKLREDYVAREQGNLFDALGQTLAGNSSQSNGEIGLRLKMTEGAVKVAAHRLRKRFREVLREEIAQTLADPGMIDEEIRDLLNCL